MAKGRPRNVHNARSKVKKKRRARSASRPVQLLVATRKGAFVLTSDAGRRSWRLAAPLFLGHVVHHAIRDARDPKTILIAARTGHLGPTVFRSTDAGKTWREATRPPAFHKAPAGSSGRVVDHTFWLTPGHVSEPGVWYAGTSPHGLFRSTDHGASWEGVDGFNESPSLQAWSGGDGTPDGPKLHSVIVDPRDAAHLYIGLSSGGVMESLDRGRTWLRLTDGLEVVRGFDAGLQTTHDPHCVRLHPADPDRLYQQNHCGIYRLDRPSSTWVRIGKNMPKDVGDVGFPLVVHPRDRDVCWVFPMDGTDVWPRTSPGGRPAVYVTRDAGETWRRQATGLPKRDAWLTVKRQAMTADDRDPIGLYFGTTSGQIWGSVDEGRRWRPLVSHLPHVYAVEAG